MIKIKLAGLLVLLILAFEAFGQTNTNLLDGTVPAPTNDLLLPEAASPPPGPDKSSPLKPILDLLGGKGTWLSTIMIWGAALSAALAPFAVWIRNKLSDAINDAAESSNVDDDAYLTALLSNPFYKFAAFLLNFINIRLPTLSELERALQLQAEAVAEAKEKKKH